MMAYPTYQYPGYQPIPYYPQPVPDQLAQLRQNQMQQSMMQGPQMPQQPVQAIPQPQQTDTGGIIWVQGDAGAKAYMVAPGNTVPLWDSEDQVIYLKSVDMSGMPSMRVLDYTERSSMQPQRQEQAAPKIDLTPYITRDELEAILAERLKRPARSNKQKEDTNDE